MPEPTSRRLVVTLAAEEFRRLAQCAEQDTRTPDQQAAHLIRRALRRSTCAPLMRETPIGAADARD